MAQWIQTLSSRSLVEVLPSKKVQPLLVKALSKAGDSKGSRVKKAGDSRVKTSKVKARRAKTVGGSRAKMVGASRAKALANRMASRRSKAGVRTETQCSGS